jgi:surface polysaccharide O-acyltransferase-like enzyme
MVKPVEAISGDALVAEFRKAEIIVSDQMRMIGIITAVIGAIAFVLPFFVPRSHDAYVEGWRIASTLSIICVGIFFIIAGKIKRSKLEKKK